MTVRYLLVFLLTFSFTTAAMAEKAVPQSKLQVDLSYAPVVAQAAPAVVNVYARKVFQVRSRTSRFANDPFFQRFFGDGFGGMPRERVQNSLGSGVIVREDGIIVTNNHVVANGDELKVVLADRREFDAEVVMQDEQSDLAILRIKSDGEKFPTLKFFNSDDAEVGDLVLAIGNPFGVGQTVTSGIISALARTHVGISDYQFFIQTDAAINPGNSGGALVSMDGRLVGVNTAIFSRSGGSNGIGFAIPANMVQLVVESALSEGQIKRPWFGASGQPVTSDLARGLGLDRPEGVLLNDIHKGGPADSAGLEIGDVVLKVGDNEVNDMQSVRYRLATMSVGSNATLTFHRNGRDKVAKLKLAPPPEDPPANETLIEARSLLYGVTVANLSPALNELKGLDTMSRGVMVMSVDGRSQAAGVGLQPGDILRQLNGTEIKAVKDVLNLVEQGGRSWALTFERNGRLFRVAVRG